MLPLLFLSPQKCEKNQELSYILLKIFIYQYADFSKFYNFFFF